MKKILALLVILTLTIFNFAVASGDVKDKSEGQAADALVDGTDSDEDEAMPSDECIMNPDAEGCNEGEVKSDKE